jgi:hypothetical protein
MSATTGFAGFMALIVLVGLSWWATTSQRRQRDAAIMGMFRRIAARNGWTSERTSNRKAPVRLRSRVSPGIGWELEYRLESHRAGGESHRALGFSDSTPYFCWKAAVNPPSTATIIVVHAAPEWLKQLRLMDQTPVLGNLERMNLMWVLTEMAGVDIKGGFHRVDVGDADFHRSFELLATDTVTAWSLVDDRVAEVLMAWAAQPGNAALNAFVFIGSPGICLVAQPKQIENSEDCIEQIAGLGMDLANAIKTTADFSTVRTRPQELGI